MKSIDFSLGDAALVARDTCQMNNLHGSVVTCRILRDALERFGYEVAPLSTQVLIFNPFVTKEFKPGHSPSKKRLNALLDHRKGHSIALGMDKSEGDGWKGHLILTMKNKEGTWLIDPTLTQASRPEHKIHMLPLGVKVNDDFGTTDGSRAILRLNDCAVLYSAFPSDKSYENVLDWYLENEKCGVDKVTNQIFERLCLGA